MASVRGGGAQVQPVSHMQLLLKAAAIAVVSLALFAAALIALLWYFLGGNTALAFLCGAGCSARTARAGPQAGPSSDAATAT